ncbi:hypothetical protein EDEG_02519 [Edhazardia aedis USNM 41457]|uniref:Uncharacterized protein n=1 Tax=Edhazardia aedis (strain USNM 41457) TaxID=1003232 RepID=J9D5R5_EDHAE|nr:hypothetical protein EDEG_02519 [Edhazardia aedis USNM 41457]|eukprot:EJW03111.1 hypothetical protein EDEG_02519 [Edhazardia aedis USNM 41457]
MSKTNQELKTRIATLTAELKLLCEYPTNSELIKKIGELTAVVKENSERYDALTGGKIKVDKNAMTKVDKELLKLKKINKERNDAFKSIFEMLLENLNMKKDELKEEIGLED